MEPDETGNAILAAIERAKSRAEGLQRGTGARETALTITKLEEALHWHEQSVDLCLREALDEAV